MRRHLQRVTGLSWLWVSSSCSWFFDLRPLLLGTANPALVQGVGQRKRVIFFRVLGQEEPFSVVGDQQ